MRKTAVLAIAVLLAGVALAACGGASTGSGGQEFPSFVYRSSLSLDGYRAAVENQDVIAMMPCYCGCSQANGHLSLHDCFLKETGGFDDHASGCDLCNKEALDAVKWHNEGRDLAQVRAMIDDKYQEYGTPTDTPLPG